MKIIAFLFFLTAFSGKSRAQAPADPAPEDVRQIFPGAPLSKDHVFHFPLRFREWTIKTSDGSALSGILFKADSSRGVVFYLHGNTGALDVWGKIAKSYTRLHYDVFMFDYRGYGKSEGRIRNENQLYADVRDAYDSIRAAYPENRIVVLGYSIGTGPAAMVAAANHPAMLILQAPYFSLADAVHHLYPAADTTGLPFRFETWTFVKQAGCPLIIFHGDADQEFYYGSSAKLKTCFKPGDRLITLKGAGHADMEKNKVYLTELAAVLP